MAVENDNSGSMSDKDKDMTRRFGGEAHDEHIEKKDTDDDSDDEKESSKDDKKATDKRAPIRSLFMRSETAGEDAKVEQTKIPKVNRNLFAGILKDDVKTDSSDVVAAEHAEAQEQIVHEAFQEVVVDRLSAVEQELEQTEDGTAEEILADASYLEDVGERIEEGLPPEQAIEDALEDQFDPPEADATEQDLTIAENFESDEEDEQTHQPATPVAAQQAPPQQPQNPNTFTPPNSAQGATSPRRGMSPITPFAPNFAGNNPNVTGVNVQNPNTVSNSTDIDRMNEFYYRKKKSRDLLVGGIVGYMIGRRGGRKRTEARFEPEIRKRDEAIGELKSKLLSTEDRVREMTREKSSDAVAKEKETVVSVHSSEVATGGENTSEIIRTEVVEVPRIETVVEHIDNIKVDTIETEKRAVAEAEKAFEATIENTVAETVSVEPEHIERVIERSPIAETMIATKVASEVEKQSQENRRKAKETQRLNNIESKKDPRNMTVPELLEIAEHIHLEKASLKDLYEHNRIDAVNMRRVVLEYLNGGNHFEKVLRGSLEAVEMQRELRHEMKQADSSFSQSGGAGNDSSNHSRIAGDATDATQLSSNVEQNALLDASAKAQQDEVDERLMVSNGTAVVIGVLMGVAIMIVLLLYTNAL